MWPAQIQLPGGDQLVAISEQGVAVILALDLLLLALVGIAALWVFDKRQTRQAQQAAEDRRAEAETDAAGENQILELVRVMTVIVNADSARQSAIERQSDNIARQTAAIEKLVAAATASNEAMLAEQRAQTALLAGLRDGIEMSGKATTLAITARLDAHDQQAREGMARIEATLAALRDEIQTGHKTQWSEVLERIDRVLAEIAALHPTPPPPSVLPPPEKLEKESAA